MSHSAKSALAETRRVVKIALAAVIGFSIIVNLLVLALPLYSLQVFDRVLSSRSVETLLALTVVTLGLLALQAALDHVRSAVLRKVALRVETSLTGPVLRASLDEGSRGSPQAVAGLRDLREVRTAVSSPGLTALFDLPLTPFFVLVVFLIHPLLGFFVIGAITILAVLTGTHALAARRPQDEDARATQKAGEAVQDYVRHAEAIQALGMTGDVERRWRKQNNQLLKLDAVLAGRVGAVLSVTKFVRMAVQVGITGLGASLALDGAITPGAMIASSLLMARALAPVEQAVGGWKSWTSAQAAGKRLVTLLKGADEPMSAVTLPRPRGDLEVTNVVFRPEGAEMPVLRGVSLRLSAGHALAIVGPSGSGKSTLMRLIAGVWKPTAGEIRIDGADLEQWKRNTLGRHIGYLPQAVQLLSGTVAENISRLEDDPASEDIIAAAQAAGVHELILRLPQGYDTVIGEGGFQLSGGQKQRIGLARALYGNPGVVILDEPNSNLDPEGEAALIDALQSCREAKRTIILVSHRPALLRSVDWIVVIRDGQVERAGARGDLMRGLATPEDVTAKEAAPDARVSQ
jgi:PrtD family type I secretion system ABC transporter